jgi:hypothetical protein
MRIEVNAAEGCVGGRGPLHPATTSAVAGAAGIVGRPPKVDQWPASALGCPGREYTGLTTGIQQQERETGDQSHHAKHPPRPGNPEA